MGLALSRHGAAACMPVRDGEDGRAQPRLSRVSARRHRRGLQVQGGLLRGRSAACRTPGRGAHLCRLGLFADWYRNRGYTALGFETLDDYLAGYWDALYAQRDANNIIAMTWTWIHNDISANEVFSGDLPKALGAIAARTLLMPCATDSISAPPATRQSSST